MLKLIASIFPILLLIYLMTRKKSMPSFRALPLVALLTYFVILIVFQPDANLVHANVLKGLLLAWTPILIIAGAIFLFRTMEVTGGLDILRRWLNSITDNKLAQLMIVGWAFPFLIEGASGFGTPAAIAAPILVGLGFPAVRVAVLTLIMNTIPVSFGAIGTPTWFGFGALDLSQSEILQISFKAAVLNSTAALVIPAVALMFVLKPKAVIKNYLFILLSVSSTVIPHLFVARYNYEFPSLIGGAIGLMVTVFLAVKKIGLSSDRLELIDIQDPGSELGDTTNNSSQKPSLHELLKASFPLWGTIILLIVTRIPAIGLKDLLTSDSPSLEMMLGSLGTIKISPSLVISLENIFTTRESWTHSLLYVPSLIPFGLISLLAIYGSSKKLAVKEVVLMTYDQMKKPALALFGALVFVSLMMMGGEESVVNLIGSEMAKLTGNSWKYFAPLMGAVGSFFSGSATISNLTFGGIQDSIAFSLGLDRTSLLALQSAGAAMGNMVCINNIVAVASILALGNQEGYMLKKTSMAMLVYFAILSLMAFFI